MKFMKILMALAMLLLIAGCGSRPIVNIADSQVVSASGRELTADQVRDGIVSAGTGSGWVMTPVAPGLVKGSFTQQQHVAVVDVRYTTKTFSITYKESSGLNYRDGQIHRTYNGWIEKLDRDIRSQLLRL